MGIGKKIFIIAGTYGEAVQFASDNNLSQDKWTFLDNPMFLNGVYNPRVFRVGSWKSMDTDKLYAIEKEIIHRTRDI